MAVHANDPQARPPRGRWLWSPAAWSLGLGLAWLLLGQQYAGQPAVHLDLTAALPGAATMQRQQAAPAHPGAATRRSTPAPQRVTSPRSSTRASRPRSTGTSLSQQHSPATSTRASTGSSPLSPHSPTASARTSTGTSEAAARAVAFAISQQGKPYEFGAEGPDAYDCSGLVWLAWQHAGLDWARMSAATQWHWLQSRGYQVPAGQLRAGDLLFYATNPYDPASHHVSMAFGHGRMVEAPAPSIAVRSIAVRIVAVRWLGLFAVARPLP